jgi:Ca2+-dependent lipid-binding protein
VCRNPRTDLLGIIVRLDTKEHCVCRNPEKDLLRIKVNDKDLIGSGDGIGYAVIPLRAFKIGEQVDLDVPLDGNKAQGSVQLSVKYSPLTGAWRHHSDAFAADTVSAAVSMAAPPLGFGD